MYRLHEEQCQDTFRIRSQVEDYEEFLKNSIYITKGIWKNLGI